MSANTHSSESQRDLFALRQPQRTSEQPIRTRRAPARVKLPTWQAALILLIGASVLILLLIRSAMGWFQTARSVVLIYQYISAETTPIHAQSETVAALPSSITNAIPVVEANTMPVAASVASVDSAEPEISVEPIVFVQDTTISNQLSRAWPDYISQWNAEIAVVATQYQLDADLIGSIVDKESTGNYYGVSYAGAVGLMGVMPYGPGFYDRPTSSSLIDPELNLQTGTEILVTFLELANYDLQLGLAAYNGGFGNALAPETQAYAESILAQYATTVASRSGINPEWAEGWTLGYEVRWAGDVVQYNRGDDSVEPIGRHLLFQGEDVTGSPVEIIGYALPLGTFMNN